MNAKGFTLIELLIVIGIIAILATVVILTLNPAELLRQSRDTTRFSDLQTVNSAMALYLSDVAAANIGTSTIACYISVDNVNSAGFTTSTIYAGNCQGRFPGSINSITAVVSSTPANVRLINGSGWMPIDFRAISTGSPLPQLPVDPVQPNTYGASNSTTSDDFFYAYAVGTNNTYEINTRIESQKFASSSVNDGGNQYALYEVGTNPGLAL